MLYHPGSKNTWATKVPNDVEGFQTEGERVFFRFLQSVDTPDSCSVAWYLPGTNGTKTQRGS